MKKLLSILLLLAAPAILLAQTIYVVLLLFVAAASGGLLIWVVDKNAQQVNMRWVILERRDHHTFVPIETNRVPVGPNKLEAFPSFFILSQTNTGAVKLYRVRLAEDWEIPNGFSPSIREGAEARPFLY